MNKANEFHIHTCPTCGSDRIKKVKRDWIGESGGVNFRVANLSYFECPDCGEKVYDREAMKKIEQKSPRLNSRRKHARIAA